MAKYTSQDIARWQAKIAKGMTRKQVAFDEGISHNALIGAMHRASGGTKVSRGAKVVKHSCKPKPKAKGKSAPLRPDIQRAEQSGPSIIQLRPNQCKFPLTYNQPHQFCGKPTTNGRIYCENHEHLCYDRTGEAQRRLKAATRWLPAEIY